MKIGAAFPSKWLKCDDLGGKRVKVTIKSVEVEDVGDGHKPVLYFRNADKGLVLNKTNAETLTEIIGDDDTDNWAGHTVYLKPDKTMYAGKRVDCIRIAEAPAAAAPAPAKPAKRQPEPEPEDSSGDDDREPVLDGEDDDGVPF